MNSGNNAGQYSCMVASLGNPTASRSCGANSFEDYAGDQQDGTDSDSNPKPLAGEVLTLRQDPIQWDEYRNQHRCLPEIFRNHLGSCLLTIYFEEVPGQLEGE